MQTFGKALRNSLPALGLGLLGALGAASVTVVAPAAYAQKVTAKKEFVENLQAAQAALNSRSWSQAIAKADAAAPHASGAQQRAAVEQIKVAASCDTSIKNHQGCIAAIEKAKAAGGLPGEVVKNYDKMLAGRYADAGNSAKALAQTKENISKYGGSQIEQAFVAKKELEAKNFVGAQTAINKAIAAGKPTSTHYNILLNALAGQNKMDEYYKTLERIAPSMGNETYWRMLIERTKKEKNYRSNDGALDVFRAMEAAKVRLKPEEQFQMAEAARNRGIAIEAANSWAILVKAGDANATKNKAIVDSVTKRAAADKATELAKSEATAATRVSGEAFRDVAEGYMADGKHAKAIELFNKALAKGEMDPGAVDYVKLRLGIAQYKSGKKADAVKTWQGIKSDNGSAWLAKTWIAISKS
jgi:tetratricopeptide (TPR) repeat protein